MSKAYRALNDKLTHALWKSSPPGSSGDEVVIYAWCGIRYAVDADRHARGVIDAAHAVITCVRCVGSQAVGQAPRESIRDTLLANSAKGPRDAEEVWWGDPFRERSGR